MTKKILVLGGKGYIASRLKQEIEAIYSTKKFFTMGAIEEEIRIHKPDIIINCIGFTGSNVEECEYDPDKTLLCNTFIPIMLSEVCLRNNIKLVHISSGCIYHYDYLEDIPLTESDTPDFLDLYYCRSKIYSDMALLPMLKEYPFLVLRFRIPLDNISTPKNLLNKLITYKKVIDIPNSITYIPDFIKAVKHLIEIDAHGIYNIVNKGGLRYPDLLNIYKKYVPDFQFEIITYDQLNLVRTNMILSTRKLENTGFKVREIHDVLEEAVKGTIGCEK